jgi:hypothetical protein
MLTLGKINETIVVVSAFHNCIRTFLDYFHITSKPKVLKLILVHAKEDCKITINNHETS